MPFNTKERGAFFSAMAPMIVGVLVLSIGLLATVMGVELLPSALGCLMLLSGLLVDLSGYFLMRQRRLGAWTYVLASAFTFSWVMVSSPAPPWKIFSGLWFIPVIGLLVTAVMPVLRPQKDPSASMKASAFTGAIIAISLVVSALS